LRSIELSLCNGAGRGVARKSRMRRLARATRDVLRRKTG